MQHTTQAGNCFSHVITGMEGLFWEKLRQKSYKIVNSEYNWDWAKSWTENMGVMWKCAHCIVNLQLPSYVQVLEVWQPGIHCLDSHSLSMKSKHSSLASEKKKNVRVQSFGNYLSESNINLIGHASVHPTRQQVLPMLQSLLNSFLVSHFLCKEIAEDQ